MNIEKIYETDDVLVINKPAGLMVHTDGRSTDSTLVDWVLNEYPELAEVGEKQYLQTGEEIPRPGIVHRLDRDTSGCMIIAKTQDMFVYLKAQFQNRQTKKTYRTFVHGHMIEDEGVIDRKIGRSRRDPRQWSADFGAKGNLRDAHTHYQTIARYDYNGQRFSYIETEPKTGRTHQIRVHLKYMSRNIVGDRLYGLKSDEQLGFERQALHAHTISFIDLVGDVQDIKAPLPDDFLAAEKILEKCAL